MRIDEEGTFQQLSNGVLMPRFWKVNMEGGGLRELAVALRPYAEEQGYRNVQITDDNNLIADRA